MLNRLLYRPLCQLCCPVLNLQVVRLLVLLEFLLDNLLRSQCHCRLQYLQVDHLDSHLVNLRTNHLRILPHNLIRTQLLYLPTNLQLDHHLNHLRYPRPILLVNRALFHLLYPRQIHLVNPLRCLPVFHLEFPLASQRLFPLTVLHRILPVNLVQFLRSNLQEDLQVNRRPCQADNLAQIQLPVHLRFPPVDQHYCHQVCRVPSLQLNQQLVHLIVRQQFNRTYPAQIRLHSLPQVLLPNLLLIPQDDQPLFLRLSHHLDLQDSRQCNLPLNLALYPRHCRQGCLLMFPRRNPQSVQLIFLRLNHLLIHRPFLLADRLVNRVECHQPNLLRCLRVNLVLVHLLSLHHFLRRSRL